MVVKVVITKEQLEEIYLEKNYTRTATAKYFNVKPRYIKGLVQRYNLNKPQQLINKNNKGGTSLGFKWWNNGIEQLFRKECPGNGWHSGRLESFKVLIKNVPHVFDKKTSDKLAELASKRFSGVSLSSAHKQKISDYWKTHTHPLKGKARSQEVKNKISKALEGHLQVAPKRELVEALSDEQLKAYLDKNNTIQFNTIYHDLNILPNQDSWETIKKEYIKRGIEFKAYTSTSLFEKEVVEYVKSIYTGTIEENVKNRLVLGEIDVYVPDEKLCIECNGCYWHRTEYCKTNDKFMIAGGKAKSYHFQKSKAIYEKGMRLIHIWEDQWKDIRLQPILKGIIQAALHVSSRVRINAEQCEVKEVSIKEYIDFCKLNAIQLTKPALIRFGLYHNGELVQLAGFNPFVNKKGVADYEWSKECKSFKYPDIIGGVVKLFEYFCERYNPASVVCYRDFNFFDGSEYKTIGFVLKEYTEVNKFYIDTTTLSRVDRSSKYYKKYMEKVVLGEWYCCYGAGRLKFIWKRF